MISGKVQYTSSTLQMVYDSNTQQVVGVRFPALAIPKGAVIKQAYIQFTSDSTSSVTTKLKITGQAADNASTFTTSSKNISSRPRTNAYVNWSPVAWTVAGETGANEKTPDLSPIVQELVSRTGWASGNAMVFIVEGSGTRTAKSNYYSGKQPKLVVVFQ